jgi:hypothetical protein
MDVDDVVHFQTGEPIARVSRANGGLIQRDMRRASRARDVLREMPIDELIALVGKRASCTNAELPMGDGSQRPTRSPTRSQPAPVCGTACRANMKRTCSCSLKCAAFSRR